MDREIEIQNNYPVHLTEEWQGPGHRVIKAYRLISNSRLRELLDAERKLEELLEELMCKSERWSEESKPPLTDIGEFIDALRGQKE